MEQTIQERFFDSLTLAELAQYETLAGFDMADASGRSARDVITPALIIALHRLGYELTAEQAGYASLADIDEVLEAAISKPPTDKTLNEILGDIRGKSPKPTGKQ
ncbi:MAG: hypothetical protein PUK40_02140 [Actinomycetaceae bacterium]|nr:hypothetical protein [Arcanobacterium sp.]MDD7504741.1 hypothetical protein [Actinomycetaceae bacterium]MDY6142736.1 hypothetical protein [Arcanobacterium sp.]